MSVPAMRRWLGDLLGLMFPVRCGACRVPIPPGEGGVCAECQSLVLGLVDQSYCGLCGQDAGPFALRPGAAGQAAVCGLCDAELYRYAALSRVGAYEPPLSDLIKQFKYAGGHPLAGPLGEWQAAHVSAQPWAARIDAVVPVPLHWRRRWGRGFNQSELLAEVVAARLGKPMAHLLARPVHRPPQASLPRSQRFENIRGVFSARHPREVRGRTLCLVDDVCTTGATLSEAARTLRNAGAAAVYAAVVAVSQPPTPFGRAMRDP
ncbi:MAG: ComF family protein [Phycisphaerae bacterium]|nr:ComF family protein [Phycisphaerae bacterium]